MNRAESINKPVTRMSMRKAKSLYKAVARMSMHKAKDSHMAAAGIAEVSQRQLTGGRQTIKVRL